MNFLNFIIDEIAETINYLKTRKDDSKVFVYRDNRWRLSRWDILKRGQIARFMCPFHWPNQGYEKRIYILTSGSYKIEGVWGVAADCFLKWDKNV